MARARPARAAPRRPARRADPAQADDRRHRHARQDDDVEHGRPRAAGLRDGSELPGRRRGPLDRRQRGLGDGGVARGRGRRVRPLAAQARAADRGAHQRRDGPPHDLQLPPRRRRDVPRLPRAGRARRWSGTGPSCSRWRRRAPRSRRSTCPTPRLAEAGSRVRARRRRGRARRPGRPQRPQRRRGADRLPARRRRPRPGRRRAARLRRRRPPLRAARHHRGRRARRRRLRPPPDRGPGDHRGRPHARPAPPRRRLPAAPLLPHPPPGARVRRRPRAAPTSSSCSTSTRPASAPRTSRASPAASSPPRPRTHAGGRPVAWLPGFDEAERLLRTTLRDGDVLLTLGAGNIDALGRRLLNT